LKLFNGKRLSTKPGLLCSASTTDDDNDPCTLSSACETLLRLQIPYLNPSSINSTSNTKSYTFNTKSLGFKSSALLYLCGLNLNKCGFGLPFLCAASTRGSKGVFLLSF
jgi:hypothetical protein